MINYAHKKMRILFAFMVLLVINGCSKEDNCTPWSHFNIDSKLAGNAWGTGGIGLADFDGDNDLDISVCRRETKAAYWYERENDSIWIRHTMGVSEDLGAALGGVAIDMNLDGKIDMAYEGVWFENPGGLNQNPDVLWIQHPFGTRAHDFIRVDIDKDGHDDLVTYDGHELAWYNTSDNLNKRVVSSGHDDHGGVAPHGFGDINGDQITDLIIPGYWYENNGDGSNWSEHTWPFEPIPNASYGRSMRSWVADINNDGENDIVYSHCDTGNSHVYWVENEGKGKNWTPHMLIDPPTREGDVPGTGSFHSLAVADLNLDGKPDIFAGEQEDPDKMWGNLLPMKPAGLKERGVIWYNLGGEQTEFLLQVIQLNNPGWHDAQIGDVDNDGDIDIVSKIWNKDGVYYHADYWRNDQIVLVSSGEDLGQTDINAYPVPAKTEIKLSGLSEKCLIVMYDENGIEVLKKLNKEKSVISLSVIDLNKGMYFIHIKNLNSGIIKQIKVVKV